VAPDYSLLAEIIGTVLFSGISVSGQVAVHSSTGKEVLYLSYRSSQDVPEEFSLRSSALFSDPQSITVAGAAKSLPGVFTEGAKKVYSTDTGDFTLTVSHQKGKKKRSVIRLDQHKVAADPFQSDRNVPTDQSVYLVLEAPTNGLFTNTEQKDLIAALNAALQATSAALTIKFVAGES
jgi:hypothetical protein